MPKIRQHPAIVNTYQIYGTIVVSQKVGKYPEKGISEQGLSNLSANKGGSVRLHPYLALLT